MSKFEMYFSVDIETDGEAPGVASMLSIGISAMHPETLEESGTFYRTLKRLPDAGVNPKTMSFWDEHIEYYVAARKDPIEPLQAMKELHAFVKHQCRLHMVDGKGPIPVFMAYPAGFDFSFVFYYLHRFLGESIFGFSSLDLKSYAMALMGTNFIDVRKENYPEGWLSELPHTHHALDDAQMQADIFRRIRKWENERRIPVGA